MMTSMDRPVPPHTCEGERLGTPRASPPPCPPARATKQAAADVNSLTSMLLYCTVLYCRYIQYSSHQHVRYGGLVEWLALPQTLPRPHIPDSQRAVAGGGHQGAIVLRHRQPRDRLAMTYQTPADTYIHTYIHTLVKLSYYYSL
jgi:hypothetical protein